jgi:hypothetical protein
MLLIAIPKSASTALMETLARAHGLRCDMWRKWPGECSREFPAFHMQHSYGWELDAATADELASSPTLFKLHILPSTNNQALLNALPKVILLRHPDDIVRAYRRGQETGVYRQKTAAFDGCVTDDDWIARAREVGLHQDLTAFRDRWLAHPGEKHIVHYEDLVRDPQGVLAGIERYWSLPASGVTELLKRKYTRLGAQSLAEHKATEALWKETGRDAD